MRHAEFVIEEWSGEDQDVTFAIEKKQAIFARTDWASNIDDLFHLPHLAPRAEHETDQQAAEHETSMT